MSIMHNALLYSRVETTLAGEIADGDRRVGEQLPTEDSLITRFGVSRITVRRAIQNLVTRGLVEIRRGNLRNNHSFASLEVTKKRAAAQ